MKKYFKRILCVTLALMMIISMCVGCKKKSAASMADVMQNAFSLEKGKFSTTFDITAKDITATVELSGETDDKATNIDVNVSAGGMNFKFANLVVFTDDVIYFNVGEVLNQLDPILKMYGSSAKDLGIDYKYVSFESKGLFAKDSNFIDTVLNDMKGAYKDLITEKDGKYSIVIDSADDVKAISKETSDIMKANVDSWADKLYKSYTSKDMQKFTDDLIDDVVSAYKTAAEKNGIDASDITKDSLFDKFNDGKLEVNPEDTVTKDSIVKEINDLADSLKDCDITDEDIDGIKATISAEQGKNSYSFSVDAASKDGDKVAMKTEVKGDSSVKVDVPSDSDVTPLKDVLVPFFEIYISMSTINSGLDDYGYGSDDYDYDDFDEDNEDDNVNDVNDNFNLEDLNLDEF